MPNSDQNLKRKAKSIVALALRNGPIEDVHAGAQCPTCSGSQEYSGITDQQMKLIMTNAVDQVYTLLRLEQEQPETFGTMMQMGDLYTSRWNEPVFRPLKS